jgi:hypothetical protein
MRDVCGLIWLALIGLLRCRVRRAASPGTFIVWQNQRATPIALAVFCGNYRVQNNFKKSAPMARESTSAEDTKRTFDKPMVAALA